MNLNRKPNPRWGIVSSRNNKKFLFGINENSKAKAWKALRNKIGKDANKWRFSARRIPQEEK